MALITAITEPAAEAVSTTTTTTSQAVPAIGQAPAASGNMATGCGCFTWEAQNNWLGRATNWLSFLLVLLLVLVMIKKLRS